MSIKSFFSRKPQDKHSPFSLKNIQQQAIEIAVERDFRLIVKKLCDHLGTTNPKLGGRLELAQSMTEALSNKEIAAFGECMEVLGEKTCREILAKGLEETKLYKLHKDGDLSLA